MKNKIRQLNQYQSNVILMDSSTVVVISFYCSGFLLAGSCWMDVVYCSFLTTLGHGIMLRNVNYVTVTPQLIPCSGGFNNCSCSYFNSSSSDAWFIREARRVHRTKRPSWDVSRLSVLFELSNRPTYPTACALAKHKDNNINTNTIRLPCEL